MNTAGLFGHILLISSTTGIVLSLLRQAKTTVAPIFASSFAVISPIPVLDPVITTIYPARFFLILHFPPLK